MKEGRLTHQGKLVAYKNDDEFLCELENVLLEDYFPGEICIDRTILENAMQNIDNLIAKMI